MGTSVQSKKILITGASSGIGAELARSLARRGHHLALTARRLPALQALAEELRPLRVQVEVAALDVCDLDAVPSTLQGLINSLGGLDIAIANAGIVAVNRTGSGHLDLDQKVMQTNYLGAIATLDAATAHFKQQGYGRLVGMSSIAAWLPIAGSGSYCASKAALTAWLNAARLELAAHKISVLSIHPGFINTEFAKNMDRYPFVISATSAAETMAPEILGSRESLIVPRWPWQVLVPVAEKLPAKWLQRFF